MSTLKQDPSRLESLQLRPVKSQPVRTSSVANHLLTSSQSRTIVYYRLQGVENLDRVQELGLEPKNIRSTFASVLETNNDNDIYLHFTPKNGAVELKVEIENCLESNDELIQYSFIQRLNNSFTGFNLSQLVIEDGYLAYERTLYYRLIIDGSVDVRNKQTKKKIQEVFTVVFGNHVNKKVSLKMKAANNQLVIEATTEIASVNVDKVVDILVSQDSQYELNEGLLDRGFNGAITVTESSDRPLSIIQRQTVRRVIVCYALHKLVNLSARDSTLDAKIIDCFAQALRVNRKEISIEFNDLSYFTEMKIVVNSYTQKDANQFRIQMLSQELKAELNRIFRATHLEEYIISRSYLESDRDSVLAAYRRDAESKLIVEKQEETVEEEEEIEITWWKFLMFFCCFCFWIIPFILCILLLAQVHELREDVTALQLKDIDYDNNLGSTWQGLTGGGN